MLERGKNDSFISFLSAKAPETGTCKNIGENVFHHTFHISIIFNINRATSCENLIEIGCKLAE